MESLQAIFGILFFFAATWCLDFLLLAALLLSPFLYYRGNETVRRVFGTGVKFIVSMFLMTIICSIVWEKFVDGKIYDCTDPLFGYLSPDGWIGAGGNWPVVVVKQIASGRPMGEPDEIKEGWSIADLWGMWFLLFGISLAISISFARWPDPAENQKESSHDGKRAILWRLDAFLSRKPLE
jgi:hypothetical protein